jgi:hypothetical protein
MCPAPVCSAGRRSQRRSLPIWMVWFFTTRACRTVSARYKKRRLVVSQTVKCARMLHSPQELLSALRFGAEIAGPNHSFQHGGSFRSPYRSFLLCLDRGSPADQRFQIRRLPLVARRLPSGNVGMQCDNPCRGTCPGTCQFAARATTVPVTTFVAHDHRAGPIQSLLNRASGTPEGVHSYGMCNEMELNRN